MKNAQKADRYNLNRIIDELRDGKFVIPDFQREFEWNPWDVRDLIKSIFQDYYIGTLLLWKGKEKNYTDLSCEKIYGFEGDGKPEFIVLDGQQRLTAMHYAFFAPEVSFPKRKSSVSFYIDINKLQNGEYDEAFDYSFYSKSWANKLSNREEQFAEHIFPLSVMGSEGWELFEWIKGYEDFWKKRADEAEANGNGEDAAIAKQMAIDAADFGQEVKDLHNNYQISYIELDQDIGVDKVCDIFTQINSKGIRLDIFDLLNAMLKPKQVQLKNMWREASKRLNFADTEKMNVYVLQVMSILLQNYCSAKFLYYLIPGQPKQVRYKDGQKEQIVLIEGPDDFLESWNGSVTAIEDAITVLRNPRDFGVISSAFIPYPSIIPAFAALRSFVKSEEVKSSVDGLKKIRKWYWASIFGNRYSSSVESTSAQDFLAMKRWFDDDDDKPQVIRDFEKNFKDQQLKTETQKGSAIYKAIFNLLVINGAKDWETFELPEYESLDDHHIVPASWGREKVGRDIHSILNRTPLTPTTNRHVINDSLPNVYLKEMFEKHENNEVWSILESHFLSRKAVEILMRSKFSEEDYYEFLEERQKSIMAGIEDLLIKERIDIRPGLRSLDAKIEQVELAVRGCIEKALDGQDYELPASVKAKVDGRISGAARRDPTFNNEYYSTLGGMLEYFDMRECQDVIVNKALWPFFAEKFGSKETLISKFNQLCGLRNAIRHSRTVTDIIRMEGEAAILWFQEIDKK